jgi:predicted metal-binding membrane protein
MLMMAAMMLPAITPMVAAHGARAARPGATALFAAAYLATWLAVGLVGYAAIEAVRSLGLGFLAWHDGGRYVAAGVIVVAGLYQLTAPKAGALRRCRERRTFLREHWRPGHLGALRMGVEHGGYCVGCSWALMAALFALGVMSLTWMAVVAALIAAERLLPRPGRLGVALVLVALGTCVVLVPGQVPALAVPGSAPMHDMPMH